MPAALNGIVSACEVAAVERPERFAARATIVGVAGFDKGALFPNACEGMQARLQFANSFSVWRVTSSDEHVPERISAAVAASV
jgi:hypothetical protein